MSVTNGYVDLRVLANELNISDQEDDPRLEYAISAASRQVDEWCGRRFWVDTDVVTRKFVPWDGDLCFVDDISTVTDLVVEIDDDADGAFETTLAIDTDFYLAPVNAAVEVPVHPYTEMWTIDTYSWPTGRRPGVQVTAKFGWPAIPDGVVTACMIQAKNIYKVTGSGVFGSQQMSADGIVMRIPGLDYVARDLLNPYKKALVA